MNNIKLAKIKQHISNGESISEAARLLNVPRSTVRYYVKKYKFEREELK